MATLLIKGLPLGTVRMQLGIVDARLLQGHMEDGALKTDLATVLERITTDRQKDILELHSTDNNRACSVRSTASRGPGGIISEPLMRLKAGLLEYRPASVKAVSQP